MMRFRYDTSNNWYKGNTHIHSTRSDGGKTYAELAQMYAGQGYDFLCHADHWVCSDVEGDEADYPLLWLDGVELHGRDHTGMMYHVVCLGKLIGLSPEMGIVAGIEAARAQGALLILAHPHWLDNSIADALRYGFHGVEVYNYVCHWLNGKSLATVHWNAMLQRDPNTLGFAVDDAHIRPEHPGWNGAWIMVNTSECFRPAIMDALWAGNYYSTQGPRIEQIEWDGEQVTLHTSPIQFARLVGSASRGARLGNFEGETMTEVAFQVPTEWPYAYIELEDAYGKRAWTNTLFLSEDNRA